MLLAGCGQNDAEKNFVAEANAACQEGRERLAALGSKPGEPLATVMRRGVDVARGTLKSLRALEVPPGLAADMERAYDALERQIVLTRRAATSAERQDFGAMRKYLRMVLEVGRIAGEIADRHGLVECADHSDEIGDSRR